MDTLPELQEQSSRASGAQEQSSPASVKEEDELKTPEPIADEATKLLNEYNALAEHTADLLYPYRVGQKIAFNRVDTVMIDPIVNSLIDQAKILGKLRLHRVNKVASNAILSRLNSRVGVKRPPPMISLNKAIANTEILIDILTNGEKEVPKFTPERKAFAEKLEQEFSVSKPSPEARLTLREELFPEPVKEQAPPQEFSPHSQAPKQSSQGRPSFQLVPVEPIPLPDIEGSGYTLAKLSRKPVGELTLAELAQYQELLAQIPREQQQVDIAYLDPIYHQENAFGKQGYRQRIKDDYMPFGNPLWRMRHDAEMWNHSQNYNPDLKIVKREPERIVDGYSLENDPRMEFSGTWRNDDYYQARQRWDSEKLTEEAIPESDFERRKRYYLRMG